MARFINRDLLDNRKALKLVDALVNPPGDSQLSRRQQAAFNHTREAAANVLRALAILASPINGYDSRNCRATRAALSVVKADIDTSLEKLYGLSPDLKKAIVSYLAEFTSRAIIEDVEEAGRAFQHEEITRPQVEDFLREVSIGLRKKYKVGR